MLGGVRRDGRSGVNPLTAMVLRVARAVALIDPKINLRVDRHTGLELLAVAAELTRLGLGFPQYANDEVVIPGLPRFRAIRLPAVAAKHPQCGDLRDAQRHPELHQNLVVRVWGWSRYFCELDEAYQNQIIGRHIYGA